MSFLPNARDILCRRAAPRLFVNADLPLIMQSFSHYHWSCHVVYYLRVKYVHFLCGKTLNTTWPLVDQLDGRSFTKLFAGRSFNLGFRTVYIGTDGMRYREILLARFNRSTGIFEVIMQMNQCDMNVLLQIWQLWAFSDDMVPQLDQQYNHGFVAGPYRLVRLPDPSTGRASLWLQK